VLGEDVEAVFDVEVDIFDKLVAGRGFDGFLLLSHFPFSDDAMVSLKANRPTLSFRPVLTKCDHP
jgi:hypothetical protein